MAFLRVRNIITIRQNGNGRTKSFTMNFANKFDIESGWENLTDTASVTLPRKVYVRFEDNSLSPLFGKNIGGFSGGENLIQRGDSIDIYAGYKWTNSDGSESDKVALQFTGYVSDIDTKSPFTMKCENYMWKLKQVPVENKIWKGYTFTKMISEMLNGTDISISKKSTIGVEFNVGYFVTNNESVAQVLDRIKKDYRLYSFIRGNELRFGYPVYDESEALEHSFHFQKTIIEDDLCYKRKDDIVLSAVLKTEKTVVSGTTKKGKQKTKKERVQYLITLKNGEFTSQKIEKGQTVPANLIGERRTLIYPDNMSDEQLIEAGKNDLKRYYYTGLSGNFTTFGYPFVKHGDNVRLTDDIFPEKNGLYKVKSVKYSSGTGGLRQEIELDYRIDGN